MYYKMYDSESDDLIQAYQSDLLTDVSKNKLLIEHKPISISMDIIDMSGDIVLVNGSYNTIENFELYSQSDQEMIELSFFLEGSIAIKGTGFNEFEELKSGYILLYYAPISNGVSRFKRNTTFKVFNVSITKEYFQKNIVHHISSDFDIFYKKVEQGIPDMLRVNLSPALVYISNTIMTHDFPSDLAKIFFKEKIIEIFVLMAMQLRNEHPKFSFSHSDKEKLHYVRDLLRQKPDYPWSLKTISKEIALNEFKLKKGFKELFNETVFSYLMKLRLTNAYHLLSNSNASIYEAALCSGYKNPQHFSTAFKKYFGITPVKLKKSV